MPHPWFALASDQATTLSHRAFQASMFQLADTWCLGIHELEYITFLDRLYEMVTTRVGHVLKPLGQVGLPTEDLEVVFGLEVEHPVRPKRGKKKEGHRKEQGSGSRVKGAKHGRNARRSSIASSTRSRSVSPTRRSPSAATRPPRKARAEPKPQARQRKASPQSPKAKPRDTKEASRKPALRIAIPHSPTAKTAKASPARKSILQGVRSPGRTAGKPKSSKKAKQMEANRRASFSSSSSDFSSHSFIESDTGP